MATTSDTFSELPGNRIVLPIILGDGSTINIKQTPNPKIKIKKYFQLVNELLETDDVFSFLRDAL